MFAKAFCTNLMKDYVMVPSEANIYRKHESKLIQTNVPERM